MYTHIYIAVSISWGPLGLLPRPSFFEWPLGSVARQVTHREYYMSHGFLLRVGTRLAVDGKNPA